MFRVTARLPVPEDAGGIWAYQDDKPPKNSIPTISDMEAGSILDRLCPGSSELWHSDGMLTIPDVFSWLENGIWIDDIYEPGVKQMVDEEFDLYLWHQRPVNGRSNNGWLRNMFFSITQQIIRQDLAHWLLYVATRPGHHPQLISYPYYAKFVFEKDNSTGFRHIDLNIDAFLATGRGGNAIQGSVSLDNESEEAGCTQLVKGFHRHIAAWWADVYRRTAANISLI